MQHIAHRCHGGVQSRPVSIRALPQRRRVQVHAAPPQPPKDKQAEAETKVDKVMEELKKSGMTAAKARQILKTWSDVGVKDPAELRKLLVSRSLKPVPGLALQALLDSIASFGGFYIGSSAGAAGDFPFRIVLEILGYFLAIYYSVQVLLELSVIGGLLYTTYKYGTNSASLLAAVTAMAGPSTGVGLVEQANRAANVFKVAAALEAVVQLLRDEYKETPNDDSLRNLGAYLTLAQARESLGFTPEKYGLNNKEASNIAYAFATYDTNANFKLEPSELRALCASLGKELDDAEVKEAVKQLDSNKNGYIEFDEFVEWWVNLNKAGAGANSNGSSN